MQHQQICLSYASQQHKPKKAVLSLLRSLGTPHQQTTVRGAPRGAPLKPVGALGGAPRGAPLKPAGALPFLLLRKCSNVCVVQQEVLEMIFLLLLGVSFLLLTRSDTAEMRYGYLSVSKPLLLL